MKKILLLLISLYAAMFYSQDRYKDSMCVENIIKNDADVKNAENIMYLYSDIGQLIIFCFKGNDLHSYKLIFTNSNHKKRLYLRKKEKKEVFFIYENLKRGNYPSINESKCVQVNAFIRITYYLKKESEIIRGYFFSHCEKDDIQKKMQNLLMLQKWRWDKS